MASRTMTKFRYAMVTTGSVILLATTIAHQAGVKLPYLWIWGSGVGAAAIAGASTLKEGMFTPVAQRVETIKPKAHDRATNLVTVGVDGYAYDLSEPPLDRRIEVAQPETVKPIAVHIQPTLRDEAIADEIIASELTPEQRMAEEFDFDSLLDEVMGVESRGEAEDRELACAETEEDLWS